MAILTEDQLTLLRVCAGLRGEIRFRTSPPTGTVVESHHLPGGPHLTSVVDIWDLADQGLLDVTYGETPHSGSIRVTPLGHRAAADGSASVRGADRGTADDRAAGDGVADGGAAAGSAGGGGASGG